MANNLQDIDNALMQLVREALNTGMGLLQEEDTDIVPTLITEVAIIVLHEKLDSISDIIHRLLTEKAMKRGVLIYNGYLTMGEERKRTLFAEGYEQGSDTVWRFAQMYKPAIKKGFMKKGQPPEREGKLRFLTGPTELRLG